MKIVYEELYKLQNQVLPFLLLKQKETDVIFLNFALLCAHYAPSFPKDVFTVSCSDDNISTICNLMTDDDKAVCLKFPFEEAEYYDGLCQKSFLLYKKGYSCLRYYMYEGRWESDIYGEKKQMWYQLYEVSVKTDGKDYSIVKEPVMTGRYFPKRFPRSANEMLKLKCYLVDFWTGSYRPGRVKERMMWPLWLSLSEDFFRKRFCK